MVKCTKCVLGSLPNTSNCIGVRRAGEYKPLNLKKDDLSNIDYLLVGEALGADEDKVGLPFVGKPGSFLEKVLRTLEIDLDRVAITNAVKCKPKSGAKPSIACKRACRPYLDEEIDAIDPKAIVVLGAQPLSAILDSSSANLSKHRLKKLMYRDRPVLVTYHPKDVLKDKSRISEFASDLYHYMVREIWKKDGSELQGLSIRLIRTEASYQALLALIKKSTTIGVDLETEGLYGRILTLAVSFPESDEKKSWVIPLYHKEGSLFGVRDKVKELAGILLSEGKTLVGQHLQYDIKTLLLYGVDPGVVPKNRAEDSELYHYQLDENADVRDLDFLSQAYTEYGGYKDLVDRANLAKEELVSVARYNGRDTILPPLIINKLTKELENQGYRSPQMEEYYSRLVPYVASMESNGFKINENTLEVVATNQEKKIRGIQGRIRRISPDINLDSPKQLSDFIFGDLGCPVPDIKDVLGKSGLPSTREDVLNLVDHPFVDLLLDLRGAQKEYRSYIQNLYKYIETDGFVRPSFFIAKSSKGGTVSRLSVKKPALQTFPREGEVRKCFVSRYSRGVLLELDASQAELRYGASWSSDPNLISIFTSGQDPHQATADLCDVSRYVGKTINFAALYGITVSGLVEKAGLSLEKAKEVKAILDREWRTLYGALDNAKKVILRNQEISTEYGRWRRLRGATMSSPAGRYLIREGVNFIIQAPASDFMQTFGHYLMLKLEGLALPVMSNHDGLTFDLKYNNLNKVLDKLGRSVLHFPKLIEEVFGVELKVPFEFKVKVGENWLEMNEVKSFRSE